MACYEPLARCLPACQLRGCVLLSCSAAYQTSALHLHCYSTGISFRIQARPPLLQQHWQAPGLRVRPLAVTSEDNDQLECCCLPPPPVQSASYASEPHWQRRVRRPGGISACRFRNCRSLGELRIFRVGPATFTSKYGRVVQSRTHKTLSTLQDWHARRAAALSDRDCVLHSTAARDADSGAGVACCLQPVESRCDGLSGLNYDRSGANHHPGPSWHCQVAGDSERQSLPA